MRLEAEADGRFALLNTYPSPFVLNQKVACSDGFEIRRRIMATLGLILLDSLDLGGHKPGVPVIVLENGSHAQKVQMCDLEKHELLLHGLVRGSVEHWMTETAFTGALTRIDRGRNFKLAGINAAWHRCEAMKMRMLFEYCMRQVKRPGFSRYVVVNRLRGIFVVAGGRLPGADPGTESLPTESQQPSPDAAAAGQDDASAGPAGDDDASAAAVEAMSIESSECEEEAAADTGSSAAPAGGNDESTACGGQERAQGPFQECRCGSFGTCGLSTSP